MKSLIDQNIFGGTFGIGRGNCPRSPPVYAPVQGTDILKFGKNPLIYSVSYFNFGGFVAFWEV